MCEYARASRKQRVLLPLVDHLTGRGEIENRSWAVWQSEPVRAGARTTSSWRSIAANAAVAAVAAAAAAAAAWCSVRFRCSGCLVFRRASALRSCFIVLSGVLFCRRVVSPPSKQFLRSVSVFFFSRCFVVVVSRFCCGFCLGTGFFFQGVPSRTKGGARSFFPSLTPVVTSVSRQHFRLFFFCFLLVAR